LVPLTAPPAALPSAPPNAAPPEPIPVDLKAIEQAFTAAGSARFLDLSGRFTFEDRSKLAQAVNDVAVKTGAKVYVLALPGKTDVNNFAAIHADMKLAPKDVLFIFSADKRHLHSQAIPKSVGNDILKETNKEFYKSQTNGVLQMLDQISARLANVITASTAAPSAQPGAPAKKPMLPVEWVLIALAIGVIAWLMFKSNKGPAPKPVRKSKP
jgi:hypothetical protein